jgi:hypothetical protein
MLVQRRAVPRQTCLNGAPVLRCGTATGTSCTCCHPARSSRRYASEKKCTVWPDSSGHVIRLKLTRGQAAGAQRTVLQRVDMEHEQPARTDKPGDRPSHRPPGGQLGGRGLASQELSGGSARAPSRIMSLASLRHGFAQPAGNASVRPPEASKRTGSRGRNFAPQGLTNNRSGNRKN